MRQRKWQLVPQVEQPTQRTLVFLLPLYGRGILQQFDPVVSYTMFSAPGRGPCGGPRSCLLCNWASCRTGMLHSGHTFRTSSHLIRHLQNETPQEGRHQCRAHGTSAHSPTHPHILHVEHICRPEQPGPNELHPQWRTHFTLWRSQSSKHAAPSVTVVS